MIVIATNSNVMRLDDCRVGKLCGLEFGVTLGRTLIWVTSIEGMMIEDVVLEVVNTESSMLATLGIEVVWNSDGSNPETWMRLAWKKYCVIVEKKYKTESLLHIESTQDGYAKYLHTKEYVEYWDIDQLPMANLCVLR